MIEEGRILLPRHASFLLAFEAEMTASYLSQIEGGKRNPSLQALHRLSCALRLDLEELLKA